MRAALTKPKRGVKMAVKEVFNCNSVEEVVKLLDEYKGRAKLIAGGTDIIVAMKEKKIDPEVLIDISKLKELTEIKTEGDKIVIGAATTFTQIVNNPLIQDDFHGLYVACKSVGAPQIKNKGTVGGNIANSSPAADSVPPLLCLDAELELVSIDGTRMVRLEDYYIDKENYGLKDNEIIKSVVFSKIEEKERLTFAKLGLRKALAISRLTISALIKLNDDKHIEEVKLASGTISKYPIREYRVEEYLLGKELNPDTIDEAVKVLQEEMDLRLEGRSTLPYKRRAVESILKEVLYERLNFEVKQ